MKKLIFIITFFFCIVTVINAQVEHLKGVVIDSQTSEPVPFATLYSLNDRTGSYTNEFGIFLIKISNLKDSIVISSVGYQSDTLSTEDFTILEEFTIKLNRKNYELPTVEITPNKINVKRFDVGLFGKTPKTSLRWFHSIGDQIAVYLQNSNNKKSIIETINFTTVEDDDEKYNYTNLNMTIRLKLWSYNIYTNLPDKNLLIEDVIVHIDKVKNKNYRVNISNQNIEFPIEGLFVGIEFLGNPNRETPLQFHVGPGIACAYVNSSKSYLKGFRHTQWKDTFTEYKSSHLPKIGLTLIEIE